jgi:hypothetical protein
MPGPARSATTLAALSADLPGWIVEEPADGLDETTTTSATAWTRAAARTAISEFGQPRVILTAFTEAAAAGPPAGYWPPGPP